MTHKYNEFNIIVDTREQQPWNFKEHAVSHRKLDTGDYSVEGLENVLCIERKKSSSEFAINIAEPRFKDVIARMSQFKYAFLLLEFNLEDLLIYPIGSTVPKRLWDKVRVSPSFLIKSIMDLMIKENIKVVFCDNAANAASFAESIMKKIHYIEMVKEKNE